MEKIFLSTAIPYVNANPHIGFALEIVQADVIARFYRKRKCKVYFLTGVDENSLKIVKAAQEAKLNIKDFVDIHAKRFYELKDILNLSFDDFIRTTEKRHKIGVEKLWNLCKKDIYKKNYKGLYCVGCETFYTKKDLINGLCPEHKTKPEILEEENYFFKLSKYQNILKRIIKEDKIKIIPEFRKKEILNFIEKGLKDICISRSSKRTKGWGIKVPGDSLQIIWVWFDALTNYITALGFGSSEEKFKYWWQENKNKVHFIGKGILRFHAVYWPAILLSASLALPNKIFVHGYITTEGKKMSKSLGNVIEPKEIVDKFGKDPLRYYLLREIPSYEDGDYSKKRFLELYRSELVNDLGNLVHRVAVLARKKQIKKIKTPENKILKFSNNKELEIEKALLNFKFQDAILKIRELIIFSNSYIDKSKPWQNQKNDALSNLVYLIDKIKDLIEVFLPDTSKKIGKIIKLKNKKIILSSKIEPIFPPLL